jgi:hypothetical protein
MDQRKDSCICSDAHCQRQDSGSRESRRLAQLPCSTLNIGSDVLKKQRHIHHPDPFLHHGWVAKSQNSVPASSIRRHAGGNTVLDT